MAYRETVTDRYLDRNGNTERFSYRINGMQTHIHAYILGQIDKHANENLMNQYR